MNHNEHLQDCQKGLNQQNLPQHPIALLNFTPSDFTQFRQHIGESAPPIWQGVHPADFFTALEKATPFSLLCARTASNADALHLVRILRNSGHRFPVYILCDSNLEADYYSAQHILAPISGLAGPVSPLLAKLALSAARASVMETLMPGEGCLDEMGLAKLLLALYAPRATGVLRLSRESTSRAIFIVDGSPTYAESNLLSENFGQFLRARGVIGDVEYKWAQKLQEREGIRQGEALVKIGVLTQKGLFNLLKEQIRAKILNAFVTGQTHYRFEALEAGQHPATRFDFRLFEVLVQGLLRTSPQDQIDQAWQELAPQFFVLQPVGQTAWSAVEAFLRGRFLNGAVQGRPLAELFDPDCPLRDRVATIRALELAELGVIADAIPASLRNLVSCPEDEAPALAPFGDEEEHLELLRAKALEIQDGDLFSILQVQRTADTDEILGSYERLRARYAPNHFPNTPAVREKLDIITQRLDEAQEIITDPQKRQQYERTLDEVGNKRRKRRVAAVEAEEAYRKGLDLVESERFNEATDAFRKAQDQNPEEPLYRLYEGWSLVRANAVGQPSWSRGKQLISRALGVNPLMAMGYYFLARLSLMEEDPNEAIENLHMTLRLNPNHEPARALLSRLTQEEQPA